VFVRNRVTPLRFFFTRTLNHPFLEQQRTSSSPAWLISFFLLISSNYGKVSNNFVLHVVMSLPISLLTVQFQLRLDFVHLIKREHAIDNVANLLLDFAKITVLAMATILTNNLH